MGKVLGLLWLVCTPLLAADLTISDCDDPAAWTGPAVAETEEVRSGGAIRWEFARGSSIAPKSVPADWSGGSGLSFWAHSAVATDSPLWLIISSENSAWEGIDYYALSIRVNWTGWRHFVVPFSEIGPTRSPLGWHAIGGLMLHAAWDPEVQPDPRTVLILDEVKVVTVTDDVRGPRMTDDEFWAALDLDRPELVAVKAAIAADDRAGAAQALLTHLRQRERPRWLRDFRTRPTPHDDYDTTAADRIMGHEFTFINTTYHPEGRIDWSFNAMTEGESATIEWNAQFNRHFHFRPLLDAYWQTGEVRYAREIVDQMLAWIEDCPVLLWQSGNSPYHHAWETLNTGIRISDTWPEALFRILDSPAVTPEALVTILKSWHEQTEHLVRWPTSGNWLTCESCAVYYSGVLFPEFQRAADWRRIAIERLYGQLETDVYPDGLQYELALGYSNWVMSEFAQVLKVARHNDQFEALPADYRDRLERMYDYQLHAMRPDGKVWGLNDSGDDKASGLGDAVDYFPQREDFRWAATAGREGTPPPPASAAFPYSGHYVMRTGWQPDALHLLFDAGPFGAGHQHEDKLGILAYAYGRPLLVEGGVYMYDRSRWRRYVLSTRAHNTVRVDGLDQRSKSVRASYILPQPFTPLQNTWLTSPEADLVAGVYDYGYGDEGEATVAATHRRSVLFIKPAYWLVTDTLTPADALEHEYEAIFHLNADETTVSGERVSTVSDQANLHLQAAAAAGMAVEVVKGREEEPVQGWANGPWRPVPTALYRWRAAGPTRQVFVMYPTAAGQTCPLQSVTPVAVTTDVGEPAAAAAVLLTFADGATHLACQADPGAGRCHFGGYVTDGQAAVVMRDATGAVVGQVALGGSLRPEE